jgi:hypothetical protein
MTPEETASHIWGCMVLFLGPLVGEWFKKVPCIFPPTAARKTLDLLGEKSAGIRNCNRTTRIFSESTKLRSPYSSMIGRRTAQQSGAASRAGHRKRPQPEALLGTFGSLSSFRKFSVFYLGSWCIVTDRDGGSKSCKFFWVFGSGSLFPFL